MHWGIWGAVAMATVVIAAGAVRADDVQGQVQIKSMFSLESSLRSRVSWTEIGYRSNKEKAWAEIISPEARVSVRLLRGIFEGKLELGAITDDFIQLDLPPTDHLRAEVQLGVRLGDWSVLAEWKGRNTFSHETGDFVVGLNVYDIRVRNRFAMKLFDSLGAAQSQLSVAGGYSAALPSLFQRNFAECELEIMQPVSGGFAVTLAPKIELNDYVDFEGTDRKDAVFSLRVVPSYSFSNGTMLSLEGQATVALSTLETKTGESWAVTPIIRLQKPL
jgi:hypothetical protein